MRRLKRSGRRGNAMVESALVIWPLLLMMFGIIQIGYAVWSQSTLAYAVDAAARYASLHGARASVPATTTSIRDIVLTNALGMTPANIVVTTTWTPNNRPGSTVKVTATYPLPTLVTAVWQNPFPLKSTSQMLILN